MLTMSLRKVVLVCTGALPLLLSQASAQVATLSAVLGTSAALTSLGIQSGGLLEGSRSASKCFSGGNLKGGLKDCSDVVRQDEALPAGFLSDSDRLVTAATVDSSKNRLRQKLRSTCDYAQSQRDLGSPIILSGAENEIFGDTGFQATCCHGKAGEVLQELQVYITSIEDNYGNFDIIARDAGDLAIFFEALRTTFRQRRDTVDWESEVRSAACLRDMAKLRDETENGCGDYVLEYIYQWKEVLAKNTPLKCPGVPLDA